MKKMYAKAIVLAIMFSLLNLNICSNANAAPIGVGGEAYNFTLTTLTDEKISLSTELKTKKVVLIFFTTWCPHCASAVAAANAFNKEYGEKVRVIAIDIQEPKDKVKSFAKKTKMTYAVAIDSTGAVANRYGVSGIPTIIAIDKNNKILYRGTSISTMVKRVEF
ncbi:MAG: TlpA family protein disulfide reductase [Candidatus Omnitrophica bacterium]|nr:TlpA family protein disulfide reductase [Candidatus Omnitrophota bacterium]